MALERNSPQDLHGLCAHAAMDLFRALQEAGILAQYVVGQNHCFCMVDNLIVDTTATQFRNVDPVQGVWIADALDEDMIQDPGVWRITATFSSEADILSSDIWSEWPEAEKPNSLDYFHKGLSK